MGRRIGELPWNDGDGASLGESLLYATVCIVGLPVDVHVKNGSVFSGIFHTASVEGVILKKARMTKKGRSNSNVASGCMIETLVILAEDLVQVIAKGVELPADGITGTIAGDESESAIGTASHDVSGADDSTITTSKRRPHQRKTSVPSESGLTDGDTCRTFKVSSQREAENENEGKRMSIEVVENISKEGMEKRGGKIHIMGGGAVDASANERQVDENPQVKQYDLNRGSENKGDNKASAMQGSSSSLNCCLSQVKPVEGTHSELLPPLQRNEASHVTVSAPAKSNDEAYCRPVSAENGASRCGSASTQSVVGTSGRSLSSTVPPTEKVQLQGPESNKRAKESKLNPGAKIFSPALTNPVSATPPSIQKVTGMSYVPSASPLFPVAAAQDVGTGTFVPQPSMSAKTVQYNNYTAGNGDIGAISQAFAGNVGSRTQLLRYGGQHHSLPLGSTFVHSNPQAVMVGRMGQLVYMPVSQDLVQSGTAISPVFPRPLPTISQLQFPKHQGTLPGQPFVHQPTVGGQQLYGAASPPPLLQSPFLTSRPISVPGANGLFNTKFL